MKFIFNIWRAATLSVVCLMSVSGVACGPAPADIGLGDPPDGGDAQRLVALMDYVGGDYARAVSDGVVVSPPEYDEQLKFVSDARSMAAQLLPSAEPDDPLLRALREVDERVRAKAPPADVAAACRVAREEAVARFALRMTPPARPSLPRAEALYAQSCASCHGATGEADTERAAVLDPAPVSFKDPARLASLSPYRVYNTLTFGVPGTAMASFDTLAPAERWDLAFYVFRLGHADRSVRGPVSLALADMAGRSDAEIREGLVREGHPAPEGALAYIRKEAAFQEAPAGVGIDRTRRLLRRAAAVFETGRRAEADRLVLDAYLQGFEPLEPRLRARDAKGTLAVEAAFRDLRGAMAQGDVGSVRRMQQALDGDLQRLGEGRRAVVPVLSAFLIYFREGVEAALLVGALLAGLRRLGRADAARYVHAGWLAAIPAGLATWWVTDRVVSLAARHRELSEAIIALVAAAVLFSMSFWMISRAEARRWTGYLRKGLESSLGRRNLLLLAGVAFLAVYREAAETVLFTQALLLESAGQEAQVWGGAAAGSLAVVVIAIVLSRAAVRLPLGPFFTVSSALLCALAISFAGSGIYELVAAGYLPPRPVRFPEVPWMGIHPDLTALLVQLAILSVIAAAGVHALRRRGDASPPTP